MGAITVQKNTSYLIDLPTDFSDGGWSVSNGIAYHKPCNAGVIKNTGLVLVPGRTYIVEYNVVDYKSGGVAVRLGDAQGTIQTSGGKHVQEIAATGSELSFWSDGELGVDFVSAYDKAKAGNNGVTISFHEANNVWGSDHPFDPDLMIRFSDDFFTIKDGMLWRHDQSETRGNIYGIQHPSIITFFVKNSPTTYKWFSRIRIQSDKAWSVTNVRIPKEEGKSEEMRSVLKKGRFQKLNGEWFADFLRNMNDPRFDDELKALFRGNELKGRVMEITIEFNEPTEVVLFSVDIETDSQNFTY